MIKNILGLDLGRKSLGISISYSGKLVTPIENFRFPLDRYDMCLKKVISLCDSEMIEHIVIGLPCYKSGDPSEMTFIVNDFVEKLKVELVKNHFDKIDIIKIDEQGSTLEASHILHENNVNAKNQKKMIDCVASIVILERYLRSIKQM